MIRVAVRDGMEKTWCQVLLCQDFVKEHSRYREPPQGLANAREERMGIFPRGGGLLQSIRALLILAGGARNFTLLRGIIFRNTLEPGIYRCVSF